MKLASFRKDGRSSWGVVDNATIADVGAVLRHRFVDLREMLNAGTLSEVSKAVAASARYSLDEIEWLPVIPNPAKVLCVGLNYESHRLETGRPESSYPTIFTRFADSQIGHNAPIERPSAISTALDFEGELAVIVGKRGRYIKQADAYEHVAGYSCYNDGTLRDWQRHTHQFTPGKNFPSTGGFGPWMVTPEEMGALDNHSLTTRVNGTVVQQATFAQLNFSIPVLIEYCSTFTPLSAGDVIATGTPGGVGFKRTPPMFLKPGDRVDVEITGIGVLTNPIRDE